MTSPSTRKVIRFLESADDATFVSLTLPGLPPPRYAGVAVTLDDDTDGLVVEAEVRRGEVPVAAPYLMMSVARRNPALSRAVFAERWRAEAGSLGGEAIPDDLRGLAYVQDHPVGDDPPFDAVNEVWFDDLDALRQRAVWFAARPVPAALFDPAAAFSLVLERVPALPPG